MEINRNDFSILVETEGNDDWQLYIYDNNILILHQRYDQLEYSEKEVISIGLSYVEELI